MFNPSGLDLASVKSDTDFYFVRRKNIEYGYYNIKKN